MPRWPPLIFSPPRFTATGTTPSGYDNTQTDAVIRAQALSESKYYVLPGGSVSRPSPQLRSGHPKGANRTTVSAATMRAQKGVFQVLGLGEKIAVSARPNGRSAVFFRLV